MTGLVATIFELSLTGTLVSPELSKHLALVALSCDVATDLIIMISMFYFLRTQRTGTKLTDQLLNTLTAYTLASGFLTCITSAICLAFYVAKPKTQIYSGISFALPHLYTNSLLSLLNARQFLRDKRHTHKFDSQEPISGIVFHQPSAPTNTVSTGTDHLSPVADSTRAVLNKSDYRSSLPTENVEAGEYPGPNLSHHYRSLPVVKSTHW